MNDINRTIVRGRLTRDPELKIVGNDGRAVVKFSIANSEYWKGAENDEYVNFFECQAWGKRAEFVSKYFSKGSQIEIDGKLRQERWSGEDGKQRSRMIIIAENVFFSGSNNKKEGNQSSGQSGAGEENQDHTPHAPSGNFSEDDDIPF